MEVQAWERRVHVQHVISRNGWIYANTTVISYWWWDFCIFWMPQLSFLSFLLPFSHTSERSGIARLQMWKPGCCHASREIQTDVGTCVLRCTHRVCSWPTETEIWCIKDTNGLLLLQSLWTALAVRFVAFTHTRNVPFYFHTGLAHGDDDPVFGISRIWGRREKRAVRGFNSGNIDGKCGFQIRGKSFIR